MLEKYGSYEIKVRFMNVLKWNKNKILRVEQKIWYVLYSIRKIQFGVHK